MAITHQQIDCSTTGHIRHSLLHTRLSQMFWKKNFKLCTVYENYESRKPQELKLSCIFTGAWTDHVLAVEVKLWLGSFFSFRSVFVGWKLVMSWDWYFRNRNKEWKPVQVSVFLLLFSIGPSTFSFSVSLTDPLKNFNLNLFLEVSHRPSVFTSTNLKPLEVNCLKLASHYVCVPVCLLVVRLV